ncbi:MAG TPA: zinc-binding alcohol dehydrogenase family protein, partial [Ktedonobacteraceae bacterium]|nr:zinc-binding alcohol dehydrogenase family protein [Ktedonobacteraceae bacterium]
MKAAILHQFGEVPRYEDFTDPQPGENELLVQVKAVALENIDRAMVRGTHYASRQFLPNLPAIIGLDGIGMLEDGQLVGFAGARPPYGAMAELAVIPKTSYVPIPAGIDAVTAAALPGSALTALFPLRWGANLQPGETVLINGATGVSGRHEVQIAKLLGAGRIIGTGRHEESLKQLRELGADAVIDLKQSDEQLTEAFLREAGTTGYHAILDFVWGHPTEVLIKALVPRELSFAKHKIRLIQIGEMAGPAISLTADALRTSGLEIAGASAGITPEALTEGTNQVWGWIKEGKISIGIEQVPLKDIEGAWQRTNLYGKRMVIVP